MPSWTGPEYRRINLDFDPLDPSGYDVNNIPDAPILLHPVKMSHASSETSVENIKMNTPYHIIRN